MEFFVLLAMVLAEENVIALGERGAPESDMDDALADRAELEHKAYSSYWLRRFGK